MKRPTQQDFIQHLNELYSTKTIEEVRREFSYLTTDYRLFMAHMHGTLAQAIKRNDPDYFKRKFLTWKSK